MKTSCSLLLTAAIFGLLSASCAELGFDDLFVGESNQVRLSVSQRSYSETKSGDSSRPVRVLGSIEDGMMIEEYVSDIEYSAPVTKGLEINTTNIKTQYGAFNVMAFLDTLDNDKNKVHINDFNLTSKYSGGSWVWDGVSLADAPKWRTSTPLTMWSYSPVSADGRSAITNADVTGWTSGDYKKLEFSYAIPTDYSAKTNKDLLFAYNVEQRDFKKDASGKYITDSDGNFVLETGQTGEVDVKFYHALAAVKFVLNSSSAGADVHSVTLCYFDGSGNIVMNDGLATSGDCVATGSGTGKASVNFAWSNLGDNKPLYYTYPDKYPSEATTIAGGYAQTGQGELFMIPQTASNVRIIVQFSKYGSSDYFTKVYDTPFNVNWEAGKYYTYKLSIGEFHVPGEKYPELTNVDIQGLKSSTGQGFLRPESGALPVKGVKYVGLVLDSWRLGSKAGQTVYLNGVKDGIDQVSGVPTSSTSNPTFSFDFAPVSDTPLPNTNNLIYSFGGGSTETYSKFSSFSPPTGSNKSTMGTPKIGPFYYVFDTSGASGFQVIFKPSAADNSGGFYAAVRCMLVLEVEKDVNIPGNWEAFLASR